MTHTQRNLSVETYRPPQDLISGVAGGRLAGRNSDGISGLSRPLNRSPQASYLAGTAPTIPLAWRAYRRVVLTNRRCWAGCERAVRTEKESIWSLVNAMGKATVYLMREANSSAYEIRMSRASSGVHGSECLDSGVGQHGRSSPAFHQTAGGRQDGSYKGNRKGHTSREEVRQGNSSVDRWDSKTHRERSPLALAVLNWKEGRGDCR